MGKKINAANYSIKQLRLVDELQLSIDQLQWSIDQVQFSIDSERYGIDW